jgi:hypothetical protein
LVLVIVILFNGTVSNVLAQENLENGSSSILGVPVEIIAALIGSGIVAASVTVLGDRWMKSHDDRVEMSVRKMDTCMSNLSLYGSLASCLSGFSFEISKYGSVDLELSFYYFSIILRLRKTIYRDQGGFILDSIEGEKILGDFLQDLNDRFDFDFDSAEISKISMMSENESPNNTNSINRSSISYHEFRQKIAKDDGKLLFNIFEEWYYSMDDDELRWISRKWGWFFELFYLEVNNMFYRWYGSKRGVYHLSHELKEYIGSRYTTDPFYTELGIKEVEYIYTKYYNLLSKHSIKTQD